jgi:hypothetical protein
MPGPETPPTAAKAVSVLNAVEARRIAGPAEEAGHHTQVAVQSADTVAKHHVNQPVDDTVVLKTVAAKEVGLGLSEPLS